MWKSIKGAYQVVSAMSLAHWIWGLPWAAGAAVMWGVWAYLTGLPLPLSGLAASGFAAVAYLSYVVWRIQRAQASQEPKPSVSTLPSARSLPRQNDLAQPPSASLGKLQGERHLEAKRVAELVELVPKARTAVGEYAEYVQSLQGEGRYDEVVRLLDSDNGTTLNMRFATAKGPLDRAHELLSLQPPPLGGPLEWREYRTIPGGLAELVLQHQRRAVIARRHLRIIEDYARGTSRLEELDRKIDAEAERLASGQD